MLHAAGRTRTVTAITTFIFRAALGDAGALITYFLGLSSARTLALAVPGTDVASDADLVSGVTRFLLQSDLNLTVECVCEAS